MTKEFKHKVKVYYEDTDAGGVVYYANYLKFLERARSEAIYTIGLTNKKLLDENERWSLREIMDISGHKNLLSLQQYLDTDRKITFEKYRNLFAKEGV